MTITAPALAAVTLDRTGGGVAAVAGLLWDVLQRRYGSRTQLITLLPDGHTRPTFGDKIRFGARVAQAQLSGGSDWLLFSHLALAKAHDRVPRRLRRGYGIFLHGIEAWCPLSDREKQLLRDADLRLSNSAYTARRVMQEHPDIGPVLPCPLALRPTRDEEHSTVSSNIGSHAVLVVGRMSSSERYKGHDQLIEAWPAVVAAVPDAVLVIAGDGDDRARIEAKAASTCPTGSIRFTGFVDQSTLDGLFDEAALFALPSRGEGFGLVYLEAMQRRLACVGSVHDAAGEIVVDGVTGRLVDQADVSGIAVTLIDLLRDRSLRRRMGDAGYARLHDLFGFERFERQLTEIMSGAPHTAPAVALA